MASDATRRILTARNGKSSRSYRQRRSHRAGARGKGSHSKSTSQIPSTSEQILRFIRIFYTSLRTGPWCRNGALRDVTTGYKTPLEV